MQQLAKAIVDQAKNNVALKAAIAQSGVISTGIYFNEAINEAEFPYIVFTFVSNVPLRAFDSASDIEQYMVQFSIFDADQNSDTVTDISRKLRSAFDRETLTYTSYTPVGCILLNELGPYKIDKNARPSESDAKDRFMITQDYRISFIRT